MTSESRPKFKVYKDFNGEFKWSLYNARGESIAEAPFGFKQKARCIKEIPIVREAMSRSLNIEVER